VADNGHGRSTHGAAVSKAAHDCPKGDHPGSDSSPHPHGSPDADESPEPEESPES
jgi:hypothetical protein